MNTYATVAQKANPISNDNQQDNYRVLIKKLIQLEPNGWPKVSGKAHIQLNSIKQNHKLNKKNLQQTPYTTTQITTDNSKPLTKINTLKEKSPRTLIHSPITRINPKQNILITPTKLEPSPQPKITHVQPRTEHE